jgi:hypothetical protein
MTDNPQSTALQPLVFRPREAAKLLNRSESWLAKKRCTGTGPSYYKAGAVFYTRSSLEDWLLKQQRCTSTAEYSAGGFSKGGSYG